jgi:hypothetical protein
MPEGEAALNVLYIGAGLALYITYCAGTGIIAKTKGRSFIGWTLLSIVITPIISTLIVFLRKPAPKNNAFPENR